MKRIAFFLLLVACGERSSPPSPTPISADTRAVEVDRLDWLLTLMNGGLASMNDEELANGFSDSFTHAVGGINALRAVLAQQSQFQPYVRKSQAGAIAVVTDGRGHYLRFFSQLVANRFEGLLLQPAADLDPTLGTREEVLAALAEIAPQVVYLEADANCSEIAALHSDNALALGSAFKLYVLATLADEIAAGKRAWTDEVTIRDDWKSLPSGTMQTLPDGTKVTLESLAQQMIAISDNTATDHLLNTLGARAVESRLLDFGLSPLHGNLPFLSTRQAFTLKLMATEDERVLYATASTNARRAMLEELSSRDPRTYAGGWSAPIHIDDIEWFASPRELCLVMQKLHHSGGPAFDALTTGNRDFTGAFTKTAYKGGSEPGVLNQTWWVQRASDQTWRFVSVGFNDALQPLDEDRAQYVASAARQLAGR